MKKLARYLKQNPVVVIFFPAAGRMVQIDAMTDSDWAGDPDSRKSVGSNDLVVAGCLMHACCFMEATVAFSSGEA